MHDTARDRHVRYGLPRGGHGGPQLKGGAKHGLIPAGKHAPRIRRFHLRRQQHALCAIVIAIGLRKQAARLLFDFPGI
jgi:hypothetical protein